MGWFDQQRLEQGRTASSMWSPNVTRQPGDGRSSIGSAPTASPSTPTGSIWSPDVTPWGGWNATNVFENWDLNPLSQKTGIARDDLATQRDAFLHPIESSYRSGMEGRGQRLDASGEGLWSDPGFRSFAQTGQLPAGQTLAGLGPASEQYPFGSALSPFTGQFTAPSAQDALNTPGLQYALGRAQQAIERSAAAKGTLLTGGLLRDLSENQIGMALQGYGQAYDRARSEYDLSKSTFYEQQDRPFDKLTTLAELGKPS